jgi:folate-binding protein YgfZ
MTAGPRSIALGKPALLEFRGPDAVRFLNGQITQDVRLLAGGRITLPSCVTDAKGRLQFRIWITEAEDGVIRVEGPADSAEALEARLTRYLIADDVEVSDLTGKWSLAHIAGDAPEAPAGVMVRASARYGAPAADWWIPEGSSIKLPDGMESLEGDALETFRIARGVPAWGRELTEGILPPEAGLEATDISYQKGCYIGQEVISRIKSARKLNKRLARLVIDASIPVGGTVLTDREGNPAGNLTSVAPLADGGLRHALGFLRRDSAEELFLDAPDGSRHPVLRTLG